jgi:hypothetical protein
MRAGRMDPEGEGQTQAGRICGMIATILMLVSVVIIAGFICLGIMAASTAPRGRGF